MNLDLQGKTVWITGASSGIGAALARQLAPVASCLILSSRNKEKLDKLAGSLKGALIHVIPMDLAEADSIHRAFEFFKASVGKVDLVIHNGGISQRSLVVDTDVEVERRIMEVNFWGAVLLTKLLLPGMIQSGGGQFAVVSSITGKFGFPLRSGYAASKHALHGFFETLQTEEEKRNIRVTMVVPGRIHTPISQSALLGDGTAYEKMDPGQVNGMDVERFAKKMVKAIVQEKREVVIGGKEIILVTLRKFLPGLFFRIASKAKPV